MKMQPNIKDYFDNVEDYLGEEYIRSSLKSDYFDGGIFLINEPIPYNHRTYEELIDSRGKKHSVQIDYELKKVKLTDDMFEIYDNRDEYNPDNIYVRDIYEKCPIDVDKLYFQFNLKEYVLLYWSRGFSQLNYFRNITRNIENKTPQIFLDKHWAKQEAMKISGYYPFYEHCYGNGETNYIPDRLFFNYPNRKLALERVICGIQNTNGDYKESVFENTDYVSMTDNELVKFMNDRFIKRIKFENLIKN